MRSLIAIRQDIRRTWGETLSASGMSIIPKLPTKPMLLGTSFKVEKGRARGVVSRVVYLSPDREAFAGADYNRDIRSTEKRTLCPNASPECSGVCLGDSTGLLITSTCHNARLWKSALFLGNRRLFRELLVAESASFQRATLRSGKTPAVRVDGSSDTGEGLHLARALPKLQVYDYTKNERLALAYAAGVPASPEANACKRVLAKARKRGPLTKMPNNYHITFSYSGRNADACKRVLAAGGNVAAVFDVDKHKGEALPRSLWGADTLGGDQDDARFLDPPGGYVVGLVFKARPGNRAQALARAGSFVVRKGEFLRVAA